MSGLDGFGAALERSDMASTPTFVAVANVTNLGGPGLSRSTSDVTAHDSPDQYMEFIGSLKDGGEVSMDINWDPGDSTHANLLADFEDTSPRDYKLVFPGDLAEWDFKAIMTGFDPSYPTDDKIEASVSFKITGKPALTVA
jgi:predicted secreted protein